MSGGLKERVAVVGGGSWGTTLAHLAAMAGDEEVVLWMRDAEAVREVNEARTNRRYLGDVTLAPTVRATTELGDAVPDARLVIVCVPSSAFREVAGQAGEFVTGDQVLLSATKGLEPRTFVRMSQVLAEETCARKVGAISGPNLAKELIAGQPGATVVASRYREAIVVGAQLLHSRVLRVYGNLDVKGVELAGALKNVIAIATGVAHGLGLGVNVRAMLITRGLAEVQRLGVRLGADALTFSGLAGIGDLLATASSELSRNFRVGLGLAQGRALEAVLDELGEVAEGVNTTRVALELARSVDVPLPIIEGVGRLLFQGATPGSVLDDLMTRAARYEIDFDYTAEVR
ncbi:MAG: NAD(P)-dependent glycerol-3-phosphate dehydrogenase [Planctomycetes bacterium]|nr:NAD(P)-dependent glycerol-3-phosphate dehydrogenase [Planctomycetota bacterium]MCW8139483.1 NAD(P)-dependent glycerol-3-phosphate dehydrogenase [Planctomycetota bacterium]